MSNLTIQASFNSGEWAPTLNARVDLQKYKSGAALLENWFVDYRGGASTRPGTEYIIQTFQQTPVRLIPFQATSDVGYILEFGNGYIRFIFDKSLVLENPFNITGATKANPCVITVPGNNFTPGQWIFVTGVVGMTQLNERYFRVNAVAGAAVTLGEVTGTPLNSTGYGTYISGGTAGMVYVIPTPYNASQLPLIKFAQSVNQMILTHPELPPMVLTLITATNWSLVPAQIGTTAATPTNVVVSTSLAAGQVYYSYTVTAVDANGQESLMAVPADLAATQDIRSVAGSNGINWTAAPGAIGYNVYESSVSYFGAIPVGVEYGFIGTCTGTQFIDSNIAPDYSQTPPIANNPFQGSGVSSVAVASAGMYTTVPDVEFIGSASIPAVASAVLQVIGTPSVFSGGGGYTIGDTITFTNGVVLVVATTGLGGVIVTYAPIAYVFCNPGAVSSGTVPANPVAQITTSGGGLTAQANLDWGVGVVNVLNTGAGYLTPPTVSFSSGAASAFAALAPTSNGYPTVPSFFQQRLVLAGSTGAPQSFYMSQTGSFYNFNTSSPPQSDDAISGTLVSGQLNSIKSIVSSTAGMLILTDNASWLINGGASGTAVTPTSITANIQSANGANDVPPIVANYDILYVQQKGSSVRDLSYNIYFNVFTGTDISILASHLFFNYEILEWAWAEEPYKMVWAVRNDGRMLTLTFLKEQEFVGWTHHTTNGAFFSVATVTENTPDAGKVDAVYSVVARDVNGTIYRYIERFADRVFPNGYVDAWCVDSAIRYVGAPATQFAGAEHLAGFTVTGLADGNIIPPFVMPNNGQFTLPTAASTVIVGLGFNCDLQTLAIDLGDPTIQGKVKKIADVDVRVAEALGLEIGSSFANLVEMQDLVLGNVSSMLTGQDSQIVTDLVTGDARTKLDPTYTVPGQYCIRQSKPYPATVLGVIPNVIVGDTK